MTISPFITLGKRKIGPNYKPLIIPEMGINHNGNIERAFKIVDAAKLAGAEIIKHQTHIPDDEMSIEAKKIKPGNSDNNIYSIISKRSLSEEHEYNLLKYVKKNNMIFLSTPFGKKAVERLVKFKVDAFKIGSGEISNFPLIDFIISLKKTLIISTGMVDINYVKELFRKLNSKSCSFALLHTTSLYPTPNHLARLNIIDEFKTNFPNQVIGYSDHTIGNNACYVALSKGACIIEKHFIDNYRAKGPDIICSCDGKSLSKLIQKSEEIYELSKGNKALLKEENVTKNFAFASICSIKDIKKGEQLSSKNIWAKRPGIGYFKANDLKNLYGKKAKQDIPKNTLLKKIHI